jgi:hypothetical protein
VDEHVLEGARIAISRERLERTGSLSGRWPGRITAAELGITLQAFPEDAALPALATACKPAAGTAMAAALDDALRALGAGGWIVDAKVRPVRYKPGDRCVLRYVLALSTGATFTIVGKLYRAPTEASELYGKTRRLYEKQLAQGERPLLPRPLRLVEELGLILTEDLAMNGTVASGATVLRPVGDTRRLPLKAIENAAAALARLHVSGLLPGSMRSAATEAARARKRALRVGDFVPELATRAERLAGQIAERLEPTTPLPGVPAHGSFKPAQLVFQEERALITDFDQFCTADPALDVGYFLAYLRPHSLWYGRSGARAWFEASASTFLAAYRQEAAATGLPIRDLDSTASRSRVYEAAVLFKIANRRFNRLQSPRRRELTAILDEIESCLGGEG